jgi:hypothetical protein
MSDVDTARKTLVCRTCFAGALLPVCNAAPAAAARHAGMSRLASAGPAATHLADLVRLENARTDFVVTISRSGPRLHVVVHDCVSRFPRLSEPELVSPRAPLDERRRGLRLVNTVVAA